MIALQGDEVHLWLVDCANTDAQQWAAMLSEQEHERARAFRAGLGAGFIANRVALRMVLSAYLNQPPGDLAIVTDDQGKPILARDGAGLTFNISHSGDWLLIGIARGRRIGVDVQIERDNLRCLDLARRFFTVEEAQALADLDPQAQLRAFFAIWTLKEAQLKATGQGISGGLNRWTVPIKAAGVPDVMHVDDPSTQYGWELRTLDVAQGYAGAVAIEGRDIDVRCGRWSLGSLPPEEKLLRDRFD